MKRFSQLLLACFACLQLCGGPLGMVQVVAWSGMLVSYSQESGVVRALEKTFDGRHPCGLCLALVESKNQGSQTPEPQQAPESAGLSLSKDFAWSGELRCATPVAAELRGLAVPEPRSIVTCLTTAPSVPPPRFAA